MGNRMALYESHVPGSVPSQTFHMLNRYNIYMKGAFLVLLFIKNKPKEQPHSKNKTRRG